MIFLSPIWLFSIAAISIPVFIHLWNIRPGKTLKVGSIALFETSSRKRSRSFNLLDILLLWLRCLLLTTVGFVLAMPYFQKQIDLKASKGWLLIPKENFKEVAQRFKPKVDSLLKAGYELHYFDPDFQKAILTRALADTVHLKTESSAPYWNLIRQLNRQVPSALPVYLITPNLLNKFSDDKPDVVIRKLQWQTYTPADSVAMRIQKAWFTNNKDVHLVIETSKPAGTYYHAENISSGAMANSPYVLNVNDGKALIGIKNNDQKPIEIDTAALRIDVFAGNNAVDANYIRTVLQAVGQFTQQNIIVSPYSDIKDGLTKKAWLFWLSDQPVDQKIFDHYNNILVYENGKPRMVNTWINADEGTTQGGRPAIVSYKSISPKNNPGESIWHDGFGNPLLTAEFKGTTKIYHFYSRFNPAWNDLVWSADFPKMMLKLITPAGNDLEDDRRSIDRTQIQPDVTAGKQIQQSNFNSKTALTHYFWLLMVLVFFTERWLAHKKSAEATA